MVSLESKTEAIPEEVGLVEKSIMAALEMYPHLSEVLEELIWLGERINYDAYRKGGQDALKDAMDSLAASFLRSKEPKGEAAVFVNNFPLAAYESAKLGVQEDSLATILGVLKQRNALSEDSCNDIGVPIGRA